MNYVPFVVRGFNDIFADNSFQNNLLDASVCKTFNELRHFWRMRWFEHNCSRWLNMSLQTHVEMKCE